MCTHSVSCAVHCTLIHFSFSKFMFLFNVPLNYASFHVVVVVVVVLIQLTIQLSSGSK